MRCDWLQLSWCVVDDFHCASNICVSHSSSRVGQRLHCRSTNASYRVLIWPCRHASQTADGGQQVAPKTSKKRAVDDEVDCRAEHLEDAAEFHEEERGRLARLLLVLPDGLNDLGRHVAHHEREDDDDHYQGDVLFTGLLLTTTTTSEQSQQCHLKLVPRSSQGHHKNNINVIWRS